MSISTDTPPPSRLCQLNPWHSRCILDAVAVHHPHAKSRVPLWASGLPCPCKQRIPFCRRGFGCLCPGLRDCHDYLLRVGCPASAPACVRARIRSRRRWFLALICVWAAAGSRYCDLRRRRVPAVGEFAAGHGDEGTRGGCVCTPVEGSAYEDCRLARLRLRVSAS